MKWILQKDHQGRWYAQTSDSVTGAFHNAIPTVFILDGVKDMTIGWMLDEMEQSELIKTPKTKE